jgi:hypothetical protein
VLDWWCGVVFIASRAQQDEISWRNFCILWNRKVRYSACDSKSSPLVLSQMNPFAMSYYIFNYVLILFCPLLLCVLNSLFHSCFLTKFPRVLNVPSILCSWGRYYIVRTLFCFPQWYQNGLSKIKFNFIFLDFIAIMLSGARTERRLCSHAMSPPSPE